jgi:hypothetical protein
VQAGKLSGMKRKSSGLTEVELQSARKSPPPALIPFGAGGGAAFAVHLPEGATVAVPAGFEVDEVFALLTVVREALR